MTTEIDNIVARYERRKSSATPTYGALSPEVFMARQEKEKAIFRWIRKCGIGPVAQKRLLEIGCGSGTNLLTFLQFGFKPERLVGNELLPERARASREILPNAVQLHAGDARGMTIPVGSVDVVFQSTVFTSILDGTFQSELAQQMWSWAKPGGGILWYDFLYNNPRNRDVRGISLRRIRQLFPLGRIWYTRVTLAPPISRIVTRLSPTFYSLFNSIPAFRTHVLCWIEKEG